MSFKGRENAYWCDTCDGIIVTVDIDDGVTPFLLLCRATADCPGMMQSMCYQVPPGVRAQKRFDNAKRFDWYKPDAEEVDAMPHEYQQHYLNGGLKLRERAT